MIKVNTQNILFICGGAFDGINRKIASRLNTNIIGYNKKGVDAIDKDNILKYVSPQDIRSFGLIPEIVGRLPVVTYLHPLTKETLIRILQEPKNALSKQFHKLFEMDNIDIEFTEDAYEYIVDKAIEYKLGARGLRSIVEAVLTEAMFTLPSEKKTKKLLVDAKYVDKQLKDSNISRLQSA
jgi:ATP-dependent Clp protease ATP-binding subunit ClpX